MLSISTLLVDDNTSFLDSATRFLEADEQVKIVGRAASGVEAIEQIARLRPDVVVMDVAMPGMSGLDAARRIKSSPHAPLVVISTMHDHPEIRSAATSAQADGFVPKTRLCDELVPLLKSLCGRQNEGNQEQENLQGVVAGG